ncbi:hypothetical protein HED60_18665 [Planctomycetales bacterium ZRK34]|nr:hypothetical protein HED60_18665 [Planctomycetales bacterium ZRK34]
MRNALLWAKANPLAVICFVIIAVAVISFYYPTHVQGVAFREEMKTRQKQIDEINRFKRSSMTIPPARPDDPPMTINGVINDEAIDRLGTVYKDMESEYVNIYRFASGRNQRGHDVMLAGLFPKPLDESKPFNARKEYIESFKTLYDLLHATTPPSKEDIDVMLESEVEAFKATLFPVPNQLSEDQMNIVQKRQAEKLMTMYQRTATTHHVYAPPVQINVQQGLWEPGIFQIGDWAKPGRRPQMADIWEGQMQLWIQQDLVNAIRTANTMDDPSRSIVNVPIKRIMKMFVKPGYVGVPSGGYKGQQSQDTSRRLPDDFAASISGRQSNPIYDVRHAVLTLIVDSKQIPKVLNSISTVNFMSVIGMSYTDVDEYAALREGYIYGACDAVQLDLTIETIWLRDWTAGHLDEEQAAARNEPFNPGLMPDDVRYYLGMVPRVGMENYVPPAQRSSSSGLTRDPAMFEGAPPESGEFLQP